MKPVYYRCEICEALHAWEWNGDCRAAVGRFITEELNWKFGASNWIEKSMEDRIGMNKAQSS